MYRNEHPNPQFKRDSFICLNGSWGFFKGKIEERNTQNLTEKIEVPFCPESALSGIGDKKFIPDCVYFRNIEVSREDLEGRLVLHFGAVDHYAAVFVNGMKATEHTGGYTAFEVDITPFVQVGTNLIEVSVHDDVRENIPSGKQCKANESYGCFYTRVTGIWQTVWLERTPEEYIKSIKFYPDAVHCRVSAELVTEGKGHTEIFVFYEGHEVGHAEGDGYYRQTFDIALKEKHLWECGNGRLYDVTVKFGNDEVKSYFGLRDVGYEQKNFYSMEKVYFSDLCSIRAIIPTVFILRRIRKP